MDLCECSSACALRYDTVQRRGAVVLVYVAVCNVVGMVGRVGDRGHGNWGGRGKRGLRGIGHGGTGGCRREPIERAGEGGRGEVVRATVPGNPVGEGAPGGEVVLLVFVAHAYCRRQSGELLAKFNRPEVR